MQLRYLLAFALCLTLGSIGRASSLADLIALYNPYGIDGKLRDPKVKMELNITKEQEKGIAAAFVNPKLDDRYMEARNKITGPDQEAKRRRLATQYAEDRFRALSRVLRSSQIKRLKQIMLQEWGMTLFDHPEIRTALGISNKEVKKLQAAFEHIKEAAEAEVRAKK